MRRLFPWCGLALLAAAPVRAEAPAPKVVLEVWEAAYLDGAKMGHQHTVVQQAERDGRKVFRTTKTMHLTLKRYNSVVNQRLVAGTEEGADGKVQALSLTMFLDQGQITQSGRVEGDQLVVRTPSDQGGHAVPWNPDVLGLYRQERLFQDPKIKPGAHFRFLDYQLPFLSVVPMDVVVKDREETDVLVVKGGDRPRAERARKALLRAEVTPGKVKVAGNDIPLPRLVVWLDDEGRPVRQESAMPGLGRLTLYRTTKAVAVEEGAAPALLPDLGLNTLLTLDRPIERPHDAREIIYRITVAGGDDDPASVFARDGRQRVEHVKGNTFELRVRPVREPDPEVGDTGKVKDEFLRSSYFLDSDNERIQAVARRVAGDEPDPWRKAQRLERWVHENMKPSTAVGFATAGQVCRDLQGDCRQHGMLLAALCRAAGVPARTVVGLVYGTDEERGPILAFHMWTEVWVKGQWLMLDATLGRGSVGAAHLKVADHSWHDTQTLAPLLPVTRVLGKVKVEVVTVK
jgi:hypothetical protein